MDAPLKTFELPQDVPGAFHAAHGSLPLVTLPSASVRPYYDAEGVTIYHGDCLSLLQAMPRKSVDGVVTSPPYNTLDAQVKEGRRKNGAHGGNKWFLKQAGGYADDMPEAEYQSFISYVVAACLGRAKGLVWVNHKIRYKDGAGVHPLSFLRFPFWSEVIWNRGGTMAVNPARFLPSHEAFWGFGRPHWWDKKLAGAGSVWNVAPQLSTEHPCPFPERLIAPIIAASIPPGGIVLDPFMGSGTTLLVAKNHGRKAIGFEREERFCELAARRLAQGVLPLGGGGGSEKLSPAEKEENALAMPTASTAAPNT